MLLIEKKYPQYKVHRVKYWQTPKLKKLENLWYAKLKQEGFVDAEKTVGKDRVLVQNAPNAYRQASQVQRENKAEYYRLLTTHGNEERFRDKTEERVMLKRALGFNIKEICEELKTTGDRCHRQTVRFIIRFYEHKWGIREWTKDQLSPKWKRWKKKPLTR